MKFGFLLPNYGPTASFQLLIKSARRAEELGFESIWSTDHVVVPKSDSIPYGNLIESIISLTIAASATKRVKLGTSIIILPQREPILLAKQLASLDKISDGRLIFGAGVGWLKKEFDFLGVDFVKRGAIFEEYIQVLRTLWAGKSDFQGQYISFNEALFSPLPPQGDRLPVWIAGNSKAAIRRAARIGNAWHPVGLSPTNLAEGVKELRSISSGRNTVVAMRANIQLPGAAGMESQASKASLDTWHNITGSLDAIHKDLVDFEKAGLEYLVLWFFHEDWKQLDNSLTVFAEKLMPSFK